MNLDFLNLIFPALAALIGFPALLAALINVGKYFGVVTDGLAPKFVLYANLIALAGVGYLVATGNQPLLNLIDTQLGHLAAFLVTLLGFISNLGVTKGFNNVFRGTPVIGFSHSVKK